MAGTSTDLTINRGYIGLAASRPFGLQKTMTADETGALGTVTFENVAGFVVAVDIAYGGTSPDALTVAVTNKWDVSLNSGSGDGRITFSEQTPVVGDVNVALSGNTTAGAVVIVEMLIV